MLLSFRSRERFPGETSFILGGEKMDILRALIAQVPRRRSGTAGGPYLGAEDRIHSEPRGAPSGCGGATR
jgi:hypothetical protein